MRLLAIVGTQLRHQYFLSRLIENFEIAGILLYERTLVQKPKLDVSLFPLQDLEFEKKHLDLLEAKSVDYFTKGIVQYENDFNIKRVTDKKELNGTETIEWLKECNCDVMVDYGSGILSNEFLDACPEWTINLHGGLSPYYKGSATLFWPFYFQQPELAGITYHMLSKKIDGGEILQHFRPAMYEDDTVADIGCRAISDGSEAGVALLNKLKETGTLEKYPQKGTGKLFLEKDYKPGCVKVVYDLFEKGLIKKYLANKDEFDAPYKFVNQV